MRAIWDQTAVMSKKLMQHDEQVDHRDQVELGVDLLCDRHSPPVSTLTPPICFSY